MTVAVPPAGVITDQLKVGETCSLQAMNRKAFIRKKASIPLEGYLDVVSAILAKRTKWKVSSQASQSGWSMPTIFDGGTRSK